MFKKEIDTESMKNTNIDEKIRLLPLIDSYKGGEALLIDIKNYPGELDAEQLKIICFSGMTNEQIYKSYICRIHLKVILEENKGKIDKKLYDKVMNRINAFK